MFKFSLLLSVGLSCLIFIKNANALPQGFGQAVRSGPKSKPSNTLASSSLKSSLDEGKQNLVFICSYIAELKIHIIQFSWVFLKMFQSLK